MATFSIHFTGLIADTELLTYVELSLEQQAGYIPAHVQNAMANGSLPEKARQGALYQADALEDADTFIVREVPGGDYLERFTGTADTAFPDKTEAPISAAIQNAHVAFIAPKKYPSLFGQVYASPEACIEELKGTLRSAGIEIPREFDWMAHLVNFTGTNDVNVC